MNSVTTPGLLILAAFEPEVAPMRAPLARYERIRIATIGVGAVEGAINAYRVIASERERVGNTFEVLWVGSCGMSPRLKYPLLSLVAGREVAISDYGVISGYSRIPDIMRTEFASSSQIYETVAEQHIATTCGRFYTTLAITSNTEAAHKLAEQTSADFETMELYAVAAAANRLGVNWSTLSAITNTVGSFDDWESCFRDAARVTSSAVVKLASILYRGELPGNNTA